jgi:hypothetical protein
LLSVAGVLALALTLTAPTLAQEQSSPLRFLGELDIP